MAAVETLLEGLSDECLELVLEAVADDVGPRGSHNFTIVAGVGEDDRFTTEMLEKGSR